MAFSRLIPLCAASVVVVAAAGCLQLDQKLPLDLEEGASASKTIGPSGGVISVPPDFSMQVPPGALSGSASITIAPRISSPFPTEAGAVLPGTAYDISPAGQAFATSASIKVRVPPALLQAGDEIRLGLALLKPDGSIVTSSALYDATSGIMTAPLDELGPVAAVIEVDAIEVGTGLPPDLEGGSIGGTSSGTLSGAAGQSATSVRYSSNCSPSARRCFASGLVQAWASQNLLNRLGSDLAILTPVVAADIEFSGFDSQGRPTTAFGTVEFTGKLKARIGQSTATFDVDELRSTGPGQAASPTTVTINGNQMVLAQTSDGANTTLAFQVQKIGTGFLLTVSIDEKVELENDDGSFLQGTVTIHAKLRR